LIYSFQTLFLHFLILFSCLSLRSGICCVFLETLSANPLCPVCVPPSPSTVRICTLFFFTPRWNFLSHVSKEEEEGKVSNFLQSVVIDKEKRKSENLSEFFPLHFLYPRRVAAGHQMMTGPRYIRVYISTCVFGRKREETCGYIPRGKLPK
jgi:hypothetical protein